MAEEDYEIDVYGDAEGDQVQGAEDDYQHEQHDMHEQHVEGNGDNENGDAMDRQDDRPISASSAPQQGTKRKQEEFKQEDFKQGEDSSMVPVDNDATNAILLDQIQWWDTEEVIRGFARGAGVEEELEDIMFSEHKVNGKSKT